MPMTISALTLSAALLGAAMLHAAARQPSANDIRHLQDGVYTENQAARGRVAYENHCAMCHGDDLTGRAGIGSDLTEPRFLDRWSDGSLGDLFGYVSTRMPRTAPGSLSESVYVDTVAYILQKNGFPAGAQELQPGSLGTVRMAGPEGSAAVPNYSLVRVVGCLTENSERKWQLVGASAPSRTANPEPSDAAELTALRSTAKGDLIFQLMNPYPSPDAHKSRLVEVKGLLIRMPTELRLNVSAIQTIGDACVN